MSRIRRGLEGGRGRKRKVGEEALADLHLWEGFLDHAHKGVPMNLLVTREPDKICWSDACPYGLGGYSLSGRAWRLRIPKTSPIFGHKGINNLLEFLGMAVNIWLACLESEGGENCILAIGDNTSAIGWLHNSSRLTHYGTTEGTPPGREEDRITADRLPVLPRLATPERRTQRGRRPTVLCGRRLEGEESPDRG
ncbi:hypothetical protein MHU86_17907 [Fragilaria crotonensis]|nr:hypothetical protein MHU86_17907 [Fragilaria crotonensis]